MFDEQFADVLGARHYGYMLLQRLMGDKLIAELFEAIDMDVARESFLLVGVSPEDTERFLAVIEEAPDNLEELASEYMHVFVGPSALPAPPWESIYTNKMERLLMTGTTLAVRTAYREEGFESALYPHVPDDHVAIELDFLANMAKRALDACLADDDALCKATLSSSLGFLQEHPCKWISEFAVDLQDKAKAGFYAAIARAIDAFVQADARFLEAQAL